MGVSFVTLDDQRWEQLEKVLGERQASPAIVQNLLRHLRELGAKSYLVEDGYLDRDFTEAFAYYYSKLFKRHSKLCKRLHFFSDELPVADKLEAPEALARCVESYGTSYLGFVVLRPIHEAPLAQAVLRPPETPLGYESHLLVKAPYTAHVAGATLEVCGLPMTQQDARIGACAQATIWSAARHFHAKHKCPWVSTVTITETALTSESASMSLVVPNGSESLTLNGMVAALRAAGRHPLMYTGRMGSWRPKDIINRYVDSGIPVIVALKGSTNVGHAVIASGQIFKCQQPTGEMPERPTRAEFCAGFYVNDDQAGPNLRFMLDTDDPATETDYGLENIIDLLIPLPDKVYMPAEKAESIAWDMLELYAGSWAGLVAVDSDRYGTSIELGTTFVQAQEAGQVVARTYLTYGWKYKHGIIRNTCKDGVKRIAGSMDLPKYVWVTEFGTLESFGRENWKERHIFAHCVVDATAKNMGEDSRLFFHAPGILSRRDHNPADPFGAYRREGLIIKDDQPYRPKVRGKPEY